MNTKEVETRKLMLVYPQSLSDEEQQKIVRLTSATSSKYVMHDSSAESELIELLANCNYNNVSYRSSAMKIETLTPISMLLVDENISPIMIIDISTDVLSIYDDYLNLMMGISNIDSYIEGAKTTCETYESDHEDVIGESSYISQEMNWDEIEGVINDERDRIINKIRGVLDKYIMTR